MPKVNDHPIAGVPFRVLHRPILREPAMSDHPGKSDTGAYRSDGAITRKVVRLVALPEAPVNMPHRHRAVEDVEQVLLPGEGTALEIRVAPNPRAGDIVMEA